MKVDIVFLSWNFPDMTLRCLKTLRKETRMPYRLIWVDNGSEIANFEKRESRIDDYFALKRKFRKHAYPKKAFRIRKKSDGYEVNFKKWLKKYWDRDIVVKQEFEFALRNKGDVGDLIFLFKDLGFVQWMKKRKVSESYLHKKDKRIVIEINKVEHLGYFILTGLVHGI